MTDRPRSPIEAEDWKAAALQAAVCLRALEEEAMGLLDVPLGKKEGFWLGPRRAMSWIKHLEDQDRALDAIGRRLRRAHADLADKRGDYSTAILAERTPDGSLTIHKVVEVGPAADHPDANTEWALGPLWPVFLDVAAERIRQQKKWGDQHHDPAWWLAILVEEVGELAQAILHDRFGGRAAGYAHAEAVQVAAVAVQILEHLRSGPWPDVEDPTTEVKP